MADHPVVKNGLTLTAIAAICTALVAFTYQVTDERIAANEHELPGSDDALIYRVYAGDSPVAALFIVSARDGYAGAIKLLVGVDIDGKVTGVHVLAHRETPGLGDRIESSKTDWAQQFNGHSLGDPVAESWKIKRDGGEFDQLTGASVTPRAVVKAIRETLEYFDANAVTIFAAAANTANEVAE